jgi:hypothetical protein
MYSTLIGAPSQGQPLTLPSPPAMPLETPTAPLNQPSSRIRRDGLAVLLTRARYVWLFRQRSLHSHSHPLFYDLIDFVAIYSPDHYNTKPQNHIPLFKHNSSAPPYLMQAIHPLCHSTTELFTNRLTCSMDPALQHFAISYTDSLFAFIVDPLTHMWIGSCIVHP